ncbi:hypothetical protein GOM96_17380 [Stutzerimonas degradans]|nr:hypothetical protein GOM96_17380 [Stutzerimonas degradans]
MHRRISLFVNVSRSAENIALWLVFILIVYVMINAAGGVDLATYRDNSNLPIDEWNTYFIKEFLSWGLIKFGFKLSDLIGLRQPIVLLTIFLFIMLYVLSVGLKLDARYLPLVLVAPLSILLAFNILRQYIAIFILLVAILMLVNKRVFWFFFLSILSVFSHNSIFLVLIVVIICYYLNFKAVFFALISMQISLLVLDKLLNLNLYVSNGYNDDGSISSSIKVAFHFGYVVFLYCLFANPFGVNRGEDSDFFKKLGMGLLVFSVLIVVFPWPFWVANRFLIYVAFLYLALLLVHCDSWRVNRLRYNFFVTFLVIFNIFSVSMHGGATEMICFQSFME